MSGISAGRARSYCLFAASSLAGSTPVRWRRWKRVRLSCRVELAGIFPALTLSVPGSGARAACGGDCACSPRAIRPTAN